MSCYAKEAIDPVEPTYTWSCTLPPLPPSTADRVLTGTGPVATITADAPGAYQCHFKAKVERDCPPGEHFVGSAQGQSPPNLAVQSLLPSSTLVLGNTLTVQYEVFNCLSFDWVDLEIRNASNQLVFALPGLPGGQGVHSAAWPNGRWNQAPYVGAFANPRNSPYEVKLIGRKAGYIEQATVSVATKLELEADIDDDVPVGGSASRSAGLADLIDCLKIVMKLGPAETAFTGSGSITVTGPSSFSKHVRVDSPALNTLPDGRYDVLFRDLRDEIGNFADHDGDPANGIQPVMFVLELR